MAVLVKHQPVKAVLGKAILVAIGDVCRMFHAEMRRLDNAELDRTEWIRAEILFKKGIVFFCLGDQLVHLYQSSPAGCKTLSVSSRR